MKKIRLLSIALLFGFLLGISDGYIALWRENQTQPLRVFPYRAELLPPADRQALEKGIRLRDEWALTQLLEDYLS